MALRHWCNLMISPNKPAGRQVRGWAITELSIAPCMSERCQATLYVQTWGFHTMLPWMEVLRTLDRPIHEETGRATPDSRVIMKAEGTSNAMRDVIFRTSSGTVDNGLVGGRHTSPCRGLCPVIVLNIRTQFAQCSFEPAPSHGIGGGGTENS